MCACFVDNSVQSPDMTLVFFPNREERKVRKVRKVWRAKVGQCKCYNFFSLKPLPYLNSPLFLTQQCQNLISSWKREPKLQRRSPACQRPLVVIQAPHRELPTARSQRDQRTDCSPCRRPFWSSLSSTWRRTNLTLKRITTVPPPVLFSHCSDLRNRQSKSLCKSLARKGENSSKKLFSWLHQMISLTFTLNLFWSIFPSVMDCRASCCS